MGLGFYDFTVTYVWSKVEVVREASQTLEILLLVEWEESSNHLLSIYYGLYHFQFTKIDSMAMNIQSIYLCALNVVYVQITSTDRRDSGNF